MNVDPGNLVVWAVVVLAVLGLAALAWWIFSRMRAAPPTILSPRNGATVTNPFVVSGTVSVAPVEVTVTASCASPSSFTVMANPNWQVTIQASSTGSCTIQATVPNSLPAKITVTVT